MAPFAFTAAVRTAEPEAAGNMVPAPCKNWGALIKVSARQQERMRGEEFAVIVVTLKELGQR
jgi:hypothetical protein